MIKKLIHIIICKYLNFKLKRLDKGWRSALENKDCVALIKCYDKMQKIENHMLKYINYLKKE